MTDIKTFSSSYQERWAREKTLVGSFVNDIEWKLLTCDSNKKSQLHEKLLNMLDTYFEEASCNLELWCSNFFPVQKYHSHLPLYFLLLVLSIVGKDCDLHITFIFYYLITWATFSKIKKIANKLVNQKKTRKLKINIIYNYRIAVICISKGAITREDFPDRMRQVVWRPSWINYY